MRAVIYARYSSDKQTEQSIDGQVRVCKEYAERNNVVIVGEYFDRATSGTNDNRPSFQKMIADASKREFDTILVYRLDRFARNQYDQVVYDHKLEQLGVKVVSATETLTNTMEGKLLKSLIVSMNEMFSSELSQKVIRGNRENLLKGLWKGGNVLYGYKVVNKKVMIDETKAEIVKFIFNEYANGKSKKDIVAELNAKGHKNYSGEPFTIYSLQENLKNEKYLGIFKWHDEVFTNIYPPILDKYLFDKVQFMINKHKHAPATEKAKVEYLLTGKAFCMYCGDTFVGVSGTSHTKEKHFYYTCSTKYKRKECRAANEKKEDLENEVVRQTVDYVLKHAREIAKKLVKAYDSDINEIKIKDYEKRIANVMREIDKCVEQVLKLNNDDLVAKINDKANDLSIQKQDLENELAKLKVARQMRHTEDDFVALLGFYTNGNKDNFEYRKKLIMGLVNCVWVLDKGVIVFYNIDKRRPLTIDDLKDALKENGFDYDEIVVCHCVPDASLRSSSGSYLKCVGSPGRI